MTAVSTFPFSTIDLIQVVPTLKRSQKFLFDRFFPNLQMSDTEFVAIDIDVGIRRMAPFVSPLVAGKLVEQRRYQTNTYKPAYIKDKRAPDLRKPVMRMIGERIGGGVMTGAEREQANINFEMADQIDILDRRLEWMSAQALLNGKIIVSGEGFPTELIDFGRDASLTTALSGSAQWTPTNVVNLSATPNQNIEAWTHNILRLSGAQVTDIVFTTSPWDGFIQDPVVKGAIYYPKLSDAGNQINPGAQVKHGAVYKGRWGQFDLWVYNDWFVDDNNVEQPMIPDGNIILCGEQMLGTRAYGQIMDPAFNYEALPYAPKTWVEQDPAQRLLLMQSSPLVIPSRVNASFCANVCPAKVTP